MRRSANWSASRSADSFQLPSASFRCLLLPSQVDFEESVGAVRALRRLGIAPEVMVVPDESHGLGAYAHQLEAYGRAADFFVRHLLLT